MRLRTNINPPQRYQSDAEFVPINKRQQQQSATAARKKDKNYVDYNPNLPPAAFPTLDHALPAGQSPPSSRQPDNSAAPQVQDSGPFPHIPCENFDNFIASNGPQNPQYVRNMALLDREYSSDLDISSDEEGDELQVPGSDDVDEYQDEVGVLYSSQTFRILKNIRADSFPRKRRYQKTRSGRISRSAYRSRLQKTCWRFMICPEFASC
jgi:hypothetical protein